MYETRGRVYGTNIAAIDRAVRHMNWGKSTSLNLGTEQGRFCELIRRWNRLYVTLGALDSRSAIDLAHFWVRQDSCGTHECEAEQSRSSHARRSLHTASQESLVFNLHRCGQPQGRWTGIQSLFLIQILIGSTCLYFHRNPFINLVEFTRFPFLTAI